MSEAALRRRLERQREKVRVLEALIEERTRSLYEARQQAEETSHFLENVLHTMDSVLLVVGRDLKIRECNNSAVRILGYSRDEILDAEAATLIEIAGQAEGVARLDDLFHSKTDAHLVSRRSGRIPVLFSGTPFNDVDGAVNAVVCLATDVSERQQLESELRQAQKLESVGQMASGIAHEINTPIQFVGDSVHFLKDAFGDLAPLLEQYQSLKNADASHAAQVEKVAALEEEADLEFILEEVPPALARALEGIERVATIVRAMKEFAHPGAATMAPSDLNQAIETTATVAKNEYKYVADLELELGDLPAVPCQIGEINQVILNLIVNAAHAIEDRLAGSEERGRIGIKTSIDGGFAVIEIGDNGGGIPDEVLERIFDPFFTTKEVGRGSGQGLAIGHNVIVEKHGGTLEVETEIGTGTRFFIRLPLIPANAE